MDWGDDIDSKEESKTDDSIEKEIFLVKVPLSSKRKAAAKSTKKPKKKGKKMSIDKKPVNDDDDDIQIVEESESSKSKNNNMNSPDIDKKDEVLKNEDKVEEIEVKLEKNEDEVQKKDNKSVKKNSKVEKNETKSKKKDNHISKVKKSSTDQEIAVKEETEDSKCEAEQKDEVNNIDSANIQLEVKEKCEKPEETDHKMKSEKENNEKNENDQHEHKKVESEETVKGETKDTTSLDNDEKNKVTPENHIQPDVSSGEKMDVDQVDPTVEVKSDTKETEINAKNETIEPELNGNPRKANFKNYYKPVSSESADKDSISLSQNSDADDEKPDNDNKVNRRSSKRISTMESTPKTPVAVKSADSSSGRKLTPKQLQKKKEVDKRNEERQRAKEEREKKLEEEKERKRQAEEERKRERQQKELDKKREREEKEAEKKKERDEKEAERKRERDEKEAERKREKEERDKKKLEEMNMRNEEKRKKEELKEEERRKREEERMKKEEEQKLKEQAEENKKKKAAELFSKFFNKAKPSDRRVSHDDCNSMSSNGDVQVGLQQNFMPFRIKENMKLAPLVRKNLDAELKLKFDNILKSNTSSTDKSKLWLSEIKSTTYTKGRSEKTWLPCLEDIDDDIMIVEDELGEAADAIEQSQPKQTYRAKYLSFTENRRPAYYGTWRKRSKVINPRRPFESDKIFFDYEVDSDDEWEEEEPGESLKGSDDEDKESEDDYEVDNEFFVPHGYLSDEENKEDELEEDNHPETQKAKLKILQQEFNAEMKKKTEKIKPRLIGCIWTDKNGNQEISCHQTIWDLLQTRAILCSGPIIMSKIDSNIKSPSGTDNGDVDDKPKKARFTDEITKDLIKLVHGNLNSREFLAKEFLAYQATKDTGTEPFSKAKIASKIKEIAEYKKHTEEGPLQNKMCWIVFKEKLTEYALDNLAGQLNTWNYILVPKQRIEPKKVDDLNPVKEPECKVSTNLNITKFAKVLTSEEKRKNFENTKEKPSTPSTPNPSTPSVAVSTTPTLNNSTPKSAKPKKRIPLLMSVPCGQSIPENKKNNLISQFLMNSNKSSGANVEAVPSSKKDESTSSDKTHTKDENKHGKTQDDMEVIELE